ncbi:phage holin family protein [Sutterella sp.]|uniref:phage holin family protein n=1 Tax=Sutterella sp. TaxID=1981025 RepID=UPI0026E0A578|nr:phage holin family protein [Sutterella sp.]MDO5531072.1 phage holin family protein [Sutterella sp.]
MPEKSPQNWSLLTLLVSVIVPLCGGAIQYRQAHKLGDWSLGTFLADMFTSGFVGFMVFWVCHDALEQPDSICAALAGFAGNLGVTIFDYARWALRRRIGMPPAEQGKGEEQ